MATDIKPLSVPAARTAAKLCNIPTGTTTLLPAHKVWLDGVIEDVIKKSPNPWVDLFGYASHLGDRISNKKLSDRRCDAVMQYIQASAPHCLFPQEFGFGDAKSTGGRLDDDGEWRAVEVYVYGSVPPGKVPRPPVALPVPKEWYVTSLSGQTISAIVALGFTAIMGSITFEKPNGDKYTGAIGMIGPSIGLSYVPNIGGLLGKVPGVAGLFSRFPTLSKFLAADGLLSSWVDAQWKVLAVLGPRVTNAMEALAKGISGGASSWPSAAIGLVYGSRGRELNKIDFSGPCLCYAVTGTVAVGGFGTYVLFFGLDPHWKPWNDPVALVDLMQLEGKAKGVAVIAAASASLQFPGLGAGATIFYGEIT
jgi:hypothetical protein